MTARRVFDEKRQDSLNRVVVGKKLSAALATIGNSALENVLRELIFGNNHTDWKMVTDIWNDNYPEDKVGPVSSREAAKAQWVANQVCGVEP